MQLSGQETRKNCTNAIEGLCLSQRRLCRKNKLITEAPDRVPEVLEEITMRNILAIISVSIFFSGCCTTGEFCKGLITSDVCEGEVDGYTYTAIAYGDGMLGVVPISVIKPNTEWRFYLVPTKLSGITPSANTGIEIKGQDPAVPPVASGGNNVWINTTGDYATAERTGKLRYIAQCTPEDLVEGDYHKFEVTVDGIGMLDPRAHVE